MLSFVFEEVSMLWLAGMSSPFFALTFTLLLSRFVEPGMPAVVGGLDSGCG